MQGKMVLPKISEPPPFLQHLFTDCTPEARDFRSNIREYNSSLALTSLGVQEDVLPTRGPYTFRIHGSVYHRIRLFFPENGKPPKFSQIYIYDTAHEIAHRTEWNSNLHRDLLQKLQAVLHDCNPFVSAYKQVAKLLEREENDSMKFVLRADPTTDLRRYNLPTAAEVAVILPGSADVPSHRDIILYKQSSLDLENRYLHQ